jgi:UPF0042 nucleotide-binding protein
MELLIISGRSGSGKSTALHQLEDEGYYCIDNLPVSLLPALVAEASRDAFGHFHGTAVCIDARNAWMDLKNFPDIMASLPASVTTKVLFLDAEDSSLTKRFSETRRRHPLSNANTPLIDAIDKERELLEPISRNATLILDTSQMTIYDLRDTVKQRLVGLDAATMSVLFQSFGFKHGVPRDADLVFDVRMLPNPHWISSLRLLTGRDQAVQKFLQEQPLTDELYSDIRTYLDKWLPHYRDSNRSYITIALGCTGGQHRSVYLAESLFSHYQNQLPQVHLRHRELQLIP